MLAHELSHVANRDAIVMTFASVPRAIGETMIGEEGVVFYIWWVVWWVGVPIWAIGSLLTLTLSRYREFAADRGSALTHRAARDADERTREALESLPAPGFPAEDLRQLGRVESALDRLATGAVPRLQFLLRPSPAREAAR